MLLHPTARGLLVALLALASRGLIAQETRPVAPYVQHDTCPFECCHLGRWIAQAPIKVYAAAGSKKVIFTLPRRASFLADSGDLHFSRLGEVLMQRDTTVRGDTVDVSFKAGTRLTLLSYQGEGFWNVWYGRMITDVGQFWDFADGKANGKADGKWPGTQVVDPDDVWWVHIRRRDGRTGWIRGNQNVRGSDACE